jgi:hypothetical protein
MKNALIQMSCAACLIIAITAATSYALKNIPLSNGMKIHFVGNSLTGGNKETGDGGLASFVLAACKAAVPPIEFSYSVNLEWNRDLAYHWNNTNVGQVIKNGNFDIVVVQGYGDDATPPPNSDGTPFFEYARKFADLIKSSGAQGVFFMRQANNFIKYDRDNNTVYANMDYYDKQVATLIERNTFIGKELDMPVVACGQVWYELMKNPPLKFAHENFLYDGQTVQTSDNGTKYIDNIHQNDLGKVVNALCFYSMLMRQSPQEIYFSEGDFTDGNALLEGHARREILDAFAKVAWNVIVQREEWAGGSVGFRFGAHSTLSVSFMPVALKKTIRQLNSVYPAFTGQLFQVDGRRSGESAAGGAHRYAAGIAIYRCAR